MQRVGNICRSWGASVLDYFVRFGDAVSQLINVVAFFSINPNESLSGRAYRQNDMWFWRGVEIAINGAFRVFQKDHCKKAHEKDMSRAAKFLRNGK